MPYMNLYVDVLVPKNLIYLCCSKKSEFPPETKYRLTETDPQRFTEILNMIYKANPSQFIIRPRGVNNRCLAALETYNEEHPNNPISIETIIKSVSKDNYKWSKVGTSGEDLGKEMHEFGKIQVSPFTDGNRTMKLYIKFITPEEGSDIDVISFHRPCDIGPDEGGNFYEF